MTTTPISTVRAWVADEIDAMFAPLREVVGLLNPLAAPAEHYCPDCLTNLADYRMGVLHLRECPVCASGGAAA